MAVIRLRLIRHDMTHVRAVVGFIVAGAALEFRNSSPVRKFASGLLAGDLAELSGSFKILNSCEKYTQRSL